MNLRRMLPVMLVLNLLSIAASAGYAQKVKCVSIHGPSVNFSQVRGMVVINVIDGISHPPVWQVLGTFSPSSAFSVPLVGGLAVGEDKLLAERKIQFVGVPSFVVVEDEALIKSATFRIQGKLKMDLRERIAGEIRSAADSGYSTANLTSKKETILKLIDQAEETAVESELECAVEGIFTKEIK